MRKIPAAEPEEQPAATGKQAALPLAKEDQARRTATPLPPDTTPNAVDEGAPAAPPSQAGGTAQQQGA